jgi:putative ABC transport system permease protein
MRRIHQFLHIVRALFRRSRFEREMETELADHLACETESLIARGVPEPEARKQAHAAMGRLAIVKEECRDSRGTAAWEQLKQDALFGARMLARNRTFSLTALITIALGVGSTTAVFSLIDGIMIRPLPFSQPDRLFNVTQLGMPGAFVALRSNAHLAEYAADWGVHAFTMKTGASPERITGSEVSGNLFRVLGVNPLIGQPFEDTDDRPGGPHSLILSYDFWNDRYAQDRGIVGRYVTLDEVSYRIAGVMPARFRYPNAEANFWIPMKLDPRAVGAYWGSGGLTIVARTNPGASPAQAESEMRAWVPRIRTMFPWRMPDAWGTEAAYKPLKDYLIAGVRVKTLLLLGVTALVLLIAVVNVANLLMGQASSRERELTLRVCLGATAGRLARQLLTEALLLAGAGGACGILLAFAQLALLKNLLPPDTPRLPDLAIDLRVLTFAVCLSLGSGLLFGLLPAWRARRRRSMALGDGARTTSGPAALRADSLLVVAEAAFATILIVGAGLLLHSFQAMLTTDFGFRVESLVTAELTPNRATAKSLARTTASFEQLRQRLARYPGVVQAAGMNALPLTPEFTAFTASIEDHPRPASEPQFSLWNTEVTPEHLETLGIRLLAGRAFTPADREGAPLVALIDRATAQRYWPGQNAVGKHLKPVWEDKWRTVVGVVDGVKNFGVAGPPEWAQGQVYLPLPQALSPLDQLAIAIRVTGDPAALQKSLPALVKEVCPDCAVSKVARMENVIAQSVESPRSTAWLVGSFALLALGMAAAGIYGVVSHSVLRRTREIGVRLALGSSRAAVAWLVLSTGLRYTLFGIAIGAAASWAMAHWIRTLLFQVPEHDPVSFGLAPAVLVLVALCASLLPTSRALRIDPANSLREG